MLYQRSHQPGLLTLQIDKKHLQKRHRIFRRDREPSRIPARAKESVSNKSRNMVGHSFQNYDRVYVGFSAAYTCLHTLRMGFELIYMTI